MISNVLLLSSFSLSVVAFGLVFVVVFYICHRRLDRKGDRQALIDEESGR
jgi:hypothetical protein